MALYSGSCSAGFNYSSNDLKDDCHEAILLDDQDEKANLGKAGSCYGFITGVVETQVYFARAFAKGTDNYDEAEKYFLFCLEKGVTRIEIAKIILKYLDDFPEKLHYSPESTLIAILSTKFPCKKTSKQN